MKKFKGVRSLHQIRKEVLAKGGSWNQAQYDQGGDFVLLRLPEFPNDVLFNTVSGRFIVPDPDNQEEMLTESSAEMEGVEWYDALLELIYEPMEEGK